MIDPHRTGAVIARLRRDRDWTQLELAERLHVTHQAVSRWETGESFPDLVLLHNLARLFGVGVDALLDRPGDTDATARPRPAPGAVLDELAQGRPERVAQMIREGQADVESVAAAAPAVRPSQMEQVMQDLADYAFSVEQVISLAPFVSTALLRDLVERLDGDGGSLESAQLAALAPFLERSTVDALAARLAFEPADLAHLAALAPFASQTVLDGLVEAFEGRVPVRHAAALAPFVSQDVLDRLVGRLHDGSLDGDGLAGLAPFLARDTLRRLVEERLERPVRPSAVAALAPFVDQATLHALIRGAPDGAPEGAREELP